MNLQYSDCAEAVPAMCADVERRPSVSVSVLSVGQKRFSMDANQSLERKPHTRVDDESEIEKKYSLGEVLGQGSFGVVREVTNRLTGQKFAMKIVNKEKVSKKRGTMFAIVAINPLPFMGNVQICAIDTSLLLGFLITGCVSDQSFLHHSFVACTVSNCRCLHCE